MSVQGLAVLVRLARPRRGPSPSRPAAEPLEDRALLDGACRALLVPPTGVRAGSIGSPGERDAFEVRLPESGRLTVEVRGDFAPRLSLSGADGVLLVQSDGQTPSNPDGRIVQHLAGAPGGLVYYLTVESPDGGTGAFTLTTRFDPASPPLTGRSPSVTPPGCRRGRLQRRRSLRPGGRQRRLR